MNKIIEIEHLFASYDRKIVLRDVNLNVYERDFLGIIGSNGGGKTTLIKLILGLLKPDSGDIRFFRDGKPVNNMSMGYLPQYSAIDKKFPISVYDVILSGLSRKKSLISKFSDEHHAQVAEIITRMELHGFEQKTIGQLSGGQLQRVLLARAIVSNPEIVILDEPNTYIDKRFESRLYETLYEINKERAIILVSHDIGTVISNVKSIACVNETLDYHPESEVTAEWLEGKFECPFELLGHGEIPHRIIKNHHHEEQK